MPATQFKAFKPSLGKHKLDEEIRTFYDKLTTYCFEKYMSLRTQHVKNVKAKETLEAHDKARNLAKFLTPPKLEINFGNENISAANAKICQHNVDKALFENMLNIQKILIEARKQTDKELDDEICQFSKSMKRVATKLWVDMNGKTEPKKNTLDCMNKVDAYLEHENGMKIPIKMSSVAFRLASQDIAFRLNEEIRKRRSQAEADLAKQEAANQKRAEVETKASNATDRDLKKAMLEEIDERVDEKVEENRAQSQSELSNLEAQVQHPKAEVQFLVDATRATPSKNDQMAAGNSGQSKKRKFTRDFQNAHAYPNHGKLIQTHTSQPPNFKNLFFEANRGHLTKTNWSQEQRRKILSMEEEEWNPRLNVTVDEQGRITSISGNGEYASTSKRMSTNTIYLRNGKRRGGPGGSVH